MNQYKIGRIGLVKKNKLGNYYFRYIKGKRIY